MKIAMLVWDMSIGGGTQRQALELSRYLTDSGFEVKLYCVYLNQKKCHPELIGKVDIIGLNNDSSFKKRNLLLSNICGPFLFWREERLISKRIVAIMDNDFDLLNCHDHFAFAPAVLYKKCHDVPVVWMMNDIPNYYDPRFKYGGLKGLLYKLLKLVRGELFRQWWEVSLINKIDRVVVLDNKISDLAGRHLGKEAIVIRSGADTEIFSPPTPKTLGQGRINILANGIFFIWRRHEDLISAVKILKDINYKVHVNIIGEDSTDRQYARRIKSLIDTYGLQEEVNLLGAVSQDRLVAEYQFADVFVFPNYPQTWGLAVFEAMACGTPVIVSTGCGAAEVLTDGENALLIPFKNPGSIAEAIERLAKDNELWERLSRNGREFVLRNVRWDLYGKKMAELFNIEVDHISRRG